MPIDSNSSHANHHQVDSILERTKVDFTLITDDSIYGSQWHSLYFMFTNARVTEYVSRNIYVRCKKSVFVASDNHRVCGWESEIT